MCKPNCTANRQPKLSCEVVEDVTSLLVCKRCGTPPWMATFWAAPGVPAVTICGGCDGTLMVWS